MHIRIPEEKDASVPTSSVSLVKAGPPNQYFSRLASPPASSSSAAGPAPLGPAPPVAADWESPEDDLQEETLDAPLDDVIPDEEVEVAEASGPVAWEAWGTVAIDDRAAGGAQRFPCSFTGLPDPIHQSTFSLFEFFLPPHMVNSILEATNAAGTAKFWSVEAPRARSDFGSPCVHSNRAAPTTGSHPLQSRCLLASGSASTCPANALTTSCPPSPPDDDLAQVRQTQEAFNDHMAKHVDGAALNARASSVNVGCQQAWQVHGHGWCDNAVLRRRPARLEGQHPCHGHLGYNVR